MGWLWTGSGAACRGVGWSREAQPPCGTNGALLIIRVVRFDRFSAGGRWDSFLPLLDLSGRNPYNLLNARRSHFSATTERLPHSKRTWAVDSISRKHPIGAFGPHSRMQWGVPIIHSTRRIGSEAARPVTTMVRLFAYQGEWPNV
ncbi:hypothetical protein PG991_009373 [Apiospora marii]|uniref:Uncharacterized protein n=1 Tax=Apiospora marii TaxID=335849 RepID=A0ABR1RKE7_9PEZI